jgi:hypothetical protein
MVFFIRIYKVLDDYNVAECDWKNICKSDENKEKYINELRIKLGI